MDQLWAPIPGGADVPISGPIADGATADATNQSQFDWTVADPDLSQFVSGARRSHQCMLVELMNSAAPGLTFTNSGVYRNMDLVSASTFRRDALLSVKGLAPAAADPATSISTSRRAICPGGRRNNRLFGLITLPSVTPLLPPSSPELSGCGASA